MKNSIRKKINRLIIISIAVLSAVMVGINLVIISHYTGKDSGVMMENTCNAKVQELNNQFQLVEQSVQNIYEISEAIRPSVLELCSNDKTDAYIRNFQSLAITIADNTEGAITVYYRINPNLNVNGTQGFFYVKSAETGMFEPHEVTDILAYSVDDVEHVGWYYIPVWARKAVWMTPYYNANIGVEMISYVVPVFEDKNLIGVVGMDIDFDRIKNIAEDVDAYERNGAVLASTDNKKVYYNKCDILGDGVPDDLYYKMIDTVNSDSAFSYDVDGDSYKMFFKTLRNGMKLIFYAPVGDVNAQANAFVLSSAIILFFSIVITLFVATHMTRRIVVPIDNITETAKQYAQGNWDAKITCDSDDELKVLADNISVMADNTRQYINYIKDIAKKDALTGLRNKTGYKLYVEKINSEYIGRGKAFAIVVLDINNLKKINDTYGHEKGDVLIVDASRFICKRFAHSPVFRIGGDEFVAILDSSDYPNRNELVNIFKKTMLLAKDNHDETEVCIACGMAVYGEDGTTYDEVFDAADQRMYQNKKELKEGIKDE